MVFSFSLFFKVKIRSFAFRFMYIFFQLWSLVEFKNKINPWLRFDYWGSKLKIKTESGNLNVKIKWALNWRCLCPLFHPFITFFFRKYAIFCFKILYKRAAKIIEPTWLDFLSKNVSNYETNAVLPKMVMGISYIGTLLCWKIWKFGGGWVPSE